MTQPDSVARVRADLDVIRRAAGGDLPFGRADVWLNLALVPAGALAAAWAAAAPWPLVRYATLPGLLVLAGFAYLRYRYRRTTGRSPARRREYTLSLLLAAAMLPVVFGYLWFERRVGVPPQARGMAAVFFTGVMCAALGAADRGRRSLIACGAALMLWAPMLPYCAPRQVAVGAGVMMALAGLGAAAIQWQQLRGAGATTT